MEKIYCPYTDRELPYSETTPEHIIPLSLGGIREFTIQVESKFNSTIGHLIDGKVANDASMNILRAKKDTRGHSNRIVKAHWKQTQDKNGRPLQVTFDKGGPYVRDPKTGQALKDEGTSVLQLESKIMIDPYVKIPFSAKVALGTGHYLYGDIFRKHAAHDGLRMILQPKAQINKDAMKDYQVTYLDRVFDLKADRKNPEHQVLELMLQTFNCSAVITAYATDRLIFSIGLLGRWFSTITLPAQRKEFPDTEAFDLGHVLTLKPEGMVRLSLREAVKQLKEFLVRHP
jgi:hypothetical protein